MVLKEAEAEDSVEAIGDALKLWELYIYIYIYIAKNWSRWNEKGANKLTENQKAEDSLNYTRHVRKKLTLTHATQRHLNTLLSYR